MVSGLSYSLIDSFKIKKTISFHYVAFTLIGHQLAENTNKLPETYNSPKTFLTHQFYSANLRCIYCTLIYSQYRINKSIQIEVTSFNGFIFTPF